MASLDGVYVATRRKRLTGEQVREHEAVLAEYLAADSEEEEPYAGDDDHDIDYVPDEGEASDVEFELQVEENIDLPDPEAVAEPAVEPAANVPVATDSGVRRRLLGESEDHYECKDENILWNKQQPTPRARHWNRFTSTRPIGPASKFLPNPADIFREIITPEMVDTIVWETNCKATKVTAEWNAAHTQKKPKEWHPTDEVEIYAWIGLLLFSGTFHCNKQAAKDLWTSRHFDIYKATMSLKRFLILQRFVRFDRSNTRVGRLLSSKSAPIDDLWIMMNHNLQESYTPGAAITVDEQLHPFRGRTKFTQYIPSKPSKYAIKVWWVCDSDTKYPLRRQIYTGKLPGADCEVNQGARVVLDLVDKYRNTGRTVYCDNFFTSLDLARTLMEKGLAIVGTVRANKAFVPLCFPFNRNTKPYKKLRLLYQTLFAFLNENVTILSYVAKVDKYVILLSTQHYTRETETTGKYKPAAILDYNENKAGVDTMDQMVSGYSCKRSTNRWPLSMFYNMLDISCLASYIIHNHLKPAKKSDKRRTFILELAEQLVIRNIERRAAIPKVYGRSAIKLAMQKFNVFLEPLLDHQALKSADSVRPVSSQYRALCKLCSTVDKFQCKTRFTCHRCNDAMCLTHGREIKTYTCNVCLAGESVE